MAQWNDWAVWEKWNIWQNLRGLKAKLIKLITVEKIIEFEWEEEQRWVETTGNAV